MSSPGAGGRARMQVIAAHLRTLLDPVVLQTGCEIEDVVVSAAGRRVLVRLVVDADGGLDLDAVAEVSRSVSEVIDADAETERLLAGAYVLEVSSPGVDRPLTRPTQWRRAVGRLVEVSVDGTVRTGRVVGVDDLGVSFDVDASELHAQWAALGPGRVQVEFTHGADDISREE